MTTRDQVWGNSYLWPDGTVPYAQFGAWPRPDCSGYVGGLCWGIKTPVNTVTLVTDNWMYEIPTSDLKTGDAIGKCGIGTLGDAGHIQLFGYWTSTGLYIAEQAGGPPGPRHHTIKSIASGYKAYRFKGIDQSTGDDDVTWLVRNPADGGIYAANGVYRRRCDTPAEVEALKAAGAKDLGNVTNVAWFGLDVAHLPATGVNVELTPEQLADIGDAARQGAAEGIDGARITTTP